MKILELRIGNWNLLSLGVYRIPGATVYLWTTGQYSYSAKLLR
jgi:hypothetical protein